LIPDSIENPRFSGDVGDCRHLNMAVLHDGGNDLTVVIYGGGRKIRRQKKCWKEIERKI
jgi:hypothetical protein